MLGMTISRQTMAIIVIGAMMVGWDFANIFVSTIYYYLFNDVRPHRVPVTLSRIVPHRLHAGGYGL
jgi:hypothetical protein